MTIVLNGTTGITAPKVDTGAPAFSAYASSDQAGLTSGVYVRVNLGVEEFDTSNSFDSVTNSRFQPTVAGYYQINGVVYGGGTGLTYCIGKLVKNGVASHLGSFGNPYNGATSASSVSAVIYLNGTTDYVELWGTTSGTSGLKFSYGGDLSVTSRMSGCLVRAA